MGHRGMFQAQKERGIIKNVQPYGKQYRWLLLRVPFSLHDPLRLEPRGCCTSYECGSVPRETSERTETRTACRNSLNP